MLLLKHCFIVVHIVCEGSVCGPYFVMQYIMYLLVLQLSW